MGDELETVDDDSPLFSTLPDSLAVSPLPDTLSAPSQQDEHG